MIPKFVETHGPLTEKLVLQPASFGLGLLPAGLNPDATVKSVCGFCSTGCGLNVHLLNGEAINVTPDATYPVNLGMACPKGWESLRVLESDDRATVPLIRNNDGELRESTWSAAIQLFCDRFQEIQAKHGNAAVAFISTGQLPTEEMAFLGALAKFGMGMIHGDGNTRQCMATAVVAYKQSFGFDAPPFTYQDFEESDCLVFVGANPCIAHPILWQRVLMNQHNPKIVVVDPRTTETAMAASEHVALKPASDLCFLYGLAHQLIELDAIDRTFIETSTNGFEDFRRFVSEFSLNRVSTETGVSVDQIQRVARTIAEAKRTSLWWTMGVNQSHQGVRTAQAIINIALMTGNIGKPGTGANSITGQCNAMGSRLFSNTTNLFGHHDFTNPVDREKVARVLDIPVANIPDQPSWAYDEILAGIERGDIKGLWIIATNTVHSWINSQRARRLLGKLDFLVVQDMYRSTETAQVADLVLPAAGWGEKEGTFINSERRIGVIKRVKKAPGQALADFSIFRLVAQAWGCSDMFERWTSPESAFELMQAASEGQPCDITGIDGYDMLARHGGIQWPWKAADQVANSTGPVKERRLFSDGKFYHPDHKARFVYDTPNVESEPACTEFPYVLLTGRGTVSQWHTQTRTSKSAMLRKLYPQNAYAEINPLDARQREIGASDRVEISSRRGSAIFDVQLTNTVQPGQVFVPMHYVEANRLTLEVVDPWSRQPAYKQCAVQIKKVPQS